MDLPWVPIYIAALWALHPYLGLVAVAGTVLLIGLTLASEILTQGRYAAAVEAAAGAQRLADAAIRSRDAVEGLGMSATVVERWQARNGEALDHAEAAGDRLAVTLALTRWSRMSVQVILIAVGATLAIEQAISPGALLASSILMGRALAPVEQVIGAWRQLVVARAAWRRVMAHLAEPVLQRGMRDLPVPMGRLVAESVTAAAVPGGRPTIKSVSLSVGPGEVLVVLGPSGSGKSALARVLTGALPVLSGSVRLDGADVFAWDRDDLSRHLGYLPQDVELFDGTIREAIARMGDAPMDAVVQAARLAGIHDLVLRLPAGYDTRIAAAPGAEGVVLSHGHRQRLGLARALLGTPRIVVLDEPNAHLDGHGEIALMNAMARLKAMGVAVVATTHRPSLVRVADRVVVMREGAVERAGTRDEIVAALSRAQRSTQAMQQSGTTPAPEAQQREDPARMEAVAAQREALSLPLQETGT
jgi:ATP-binding cassette subfamily C protein/ATP-binding cassette subfamily C protein EexD